jgi:ABC-type glycerol-3-phosphate transport system permease component
MTKTKKINTIFIILLVILLFLNSLPIISMIGTSLKTEAESLSTISLFPK